MKHKNHTITMLMLIVLTFFLSGCQKTNSSVSIMDHNITVESEDDCYADSRNLLANKMRTVVTYSCPIK